MCIRVRYDVSCPVEVAPGVNCDQWRRPSRPLRDVDVPLTQMDFPADAQRLSNMSCEFVHIGRGCDDQLCAAINPAAQRYANHACIHIDSARRPMFDRDRGLYDAISEPSPPLPVVDRVVNRVIMPCRTHQIMLALLSLSGQGTAPPNAHTPKDISNYCACDSTFVRAYVEPSAVRGRWRFNAFSLRAWCSPGGHSWTFQEGAYACQRSYSAAMYSSFPSVEAFIPDYWGFDVTTRLPLRDIADYPHPYLSIPNHVDNRIVSAVADTFARAYRTPRLRLSAEIPFLALQQPYPKLVPIIDHTPRIQRVEDIPFDLGICDIDFEPDLSIDWTASAQRALTGRRRLGYDTCADVEDDLERVIATVDAAGALIVTGSNRPTNTAWMTLVRSLSMAV